LGLAGSVCNQGDRVVIVAQGDPSILQTFERRLQTDCPPLAVIASIEVETIDSLGQAEGFTIESSQVGPSARHVTPDTALCSRCLQELFDPTDRRRHHPFITCTDCGPRYTITQSIPYDRQNTTMHRFAMCPKCSREYRDAETRRFHAQPIACHDCGPRLTLHTSNPANAITCQQAIGDAAAILDSGGIVAVKGLGSYHLAARADLPVAINRLRRLKARDAKPFALMVQDTTKALELTDLSVAGIEMLRSPAAPIVLATQKPGTPIADAVAPGTHRLGVMLPYTAIHHLLLDRLTHCQALVMTSANISDEPPMINDAEALGLLASGCDAVLTHDRPIARRVDDSVVLDRGDLGPVPLRRSRGMAPSPMKLPVSCKEPGLCVGGELKCTVAVVIGGEAVVSQHLGDLKNPPAFEAFTKAIDDLLKLFEVKPAWIAHDLHPMYLSTGYAKRLAMRWQLPMVGVQHHHAHAAALLAEHGGQGPMLVAVCDGTGYGSDGSVWGGELLLASLTGSQRIGQLQTLHLIGGDAAARDTRRCAFSILHQAYGNEAIDHARSLELTRDEQEHWMSSLRNNRRCVPSTAAGRYFDGYAALLGLCRQNLYEAQAPMMLEAQAASFYGAFDPQELTSLYRITDKRGLTIDFAPLTRWVAQHREVKQGPSAIAALIHEVMAEGWADAIGRASKQTGIQAVGLTGGVFCNERLTRRTAHKLERQGLRVLIHHKLSPNDGAISFGQAAVAAAKHLHAKEVGHVSGCPRPHH
jgi:hydrogenase maturation protein HypF